MDLAEYERIQPNTVVDGILFNLPNQHCLWRVQTLETKEPDTVAWIRAMQPGETFVDIGANIGQYTLLAAKQGLRVIAFEPESQNYAVLIRNLAMNKFAASVVAFPFCISDTEKIDTLRLSSLMAGGSCHSFASDMNFKREVKDWSYRQGTVGFALDTVMMELGIQPDHIKVDVDGFEDLVVKGATKTLQGCKSVLLELDSANSDHMGARDTLLGLGFTLDQAQVDAAQRKDGPFVGIGNQIFRREQAQDPATDA